MAKPIRPGRPGWKHRSPSAQRTAPLAVAVFNLALTLGAPNGRRCQTLELQGSGIAGRGFSLEVGSPNRLYAGSDEVERFYTNWDVSSLDPLRGSGCWAGNREQMVGGGGWAWRVEEMGKCIRRRGRVGMGRRGTQPERLACIRRRVGDVAVAGVGVGTAATAWSTPKSSARRELADPSAWRASAGERAGGGSPIRAGGCDGRSCGGERCCGGCCSWARWTRNRA